MIVPMKKLGLLLHHREKERFLHALQRLGVVHLEISEEGRDSGPKRLEELKNRYQRTIKVLKESRAERRIDFRGEEKVLPSIVLDEFDGLEKKLLQKERAAKELRRWIGQLAPWGDFDPDRRSALEERGLPLRFFEMPVRYFDPAALTGFSHMVAGRDGEKVYLVLFEKGSFPIYGAVEVKPPYFSLSRALQEYNDLEEERLEIEAAIDRLTAHIGRLEDAAAELDDLIALQRAEGEMRRGGSERLLSLTGWLPSREEKRVRSFLDGYAACYHMRYPRPGEAVPVLLKNGPFARLFEPVTRIFSLPAYAELDPTPFVAPFFALFFGLCLADMGYGLILLLGSALLTILGPARFKPVFSLAMVLGMLTVIGGFMLNTVFGEALIILPGGEGGFLSSGRALAFLGPYSDGRQVVFPAMTFALVLGFVQVLTALMLQAVSRGRQFGPTFALQPVGYAGIICGGIVLAVHADLMGAASVSAGPLLVGEAIGKVPLIAGKALLYGGLILLFLFNNAERPFRIRPFLGLWELYGFATGLMGDILSYLRLFALGLAGGLLGNAVNRIAFMAVTDNTGIVDYTSPAMAVTVLILLFGHTLNFGLAALGGFVHSLRLTFVEFYKNLRFQGGSRPFEPFSLRKEGQGSI